MRAMQALSKLPGEPQTQSTVVGHQSLLIDNGIESTMAARSSTLHANAALAQPTSSMLDASTEPTVHLQPAEVISTPDL